MLQTQHSLEIGKKLAAACTAMLEGAEADENELAEVLMAAEETGEEGAGPQAFKKVLCEQAGQACAAAA